jgi:O-antigen/teichoic acid export membrane protein
LPATAQSPVAAEGGGARRLLSTFVSLVGAEVITRGLVLVVGVVLARALTPGEFGQFSYAFGVAQVAGLLVDLGLAALVIRDVSADPNRAPELLGAFLNAQGLLVTFTFALVALLTYTGLIGGPSAKSSILIATAAVCVGGVARPFEATMTGRAQAHLVTISRTVRGLVLTAGTIFVAVTDPGVDRFLIAWLVGELAGVVTIAILSVTRSVRPFMSERRQQVGRLLRMALPFAIVTAANVLYLRVDVLMLGHMKSASAVGNYGVASRVMDAAVILPAFFGNAFLATISATGPRTERGRMQTTEALRWIVLITAPVSMTLMVIADPLTKLITGGGYDQAGPILARLSVVALATASYGVLVGVQLALDELPALLRLFGVGLIVKIGVNFYAIPHFGAEGAAVTASATEVLVAAVQWRWVRKWFDAKAAGGAIARTVLAATLAGVAMALLIDVLPWPVGMVIGLGLYVLLALATGVLSRERVADVVAAVRRGGAPA